jgi:hypothetical protein
MRAMKLDGDDFASEPQYLSGQQQRAFSSGSKEGSVNRKFFKNDNSMQKPPNAFSGNDHYDAHMEQ